MKKIIVAVSFFLIFSYLIAGENGSSLTGVWKAGIARSVITPAEPIWMAGYASRNHSSEGKLVDLWAKVLAVEDANGSKVILVTADILGFPKQLSDNIKYSAEKLYSIERSQIILNGSHTHTGPVLTGALSDMYSFGQEEHDVVNKYTHSLEAKITELIGEALHSMVPVELYSGNGITRFQVNRRKNNEETLDNLTVLIGPNDYSVPVLKVVDESGNIKAVVFGYACHATTLGIYKFSGDYPGFAQIEVEKMYPGSTAMFFQGAGADQNPLPRGTIPLVKQYGSELASAVDRVLNEEMKKLEPEISTAYSEIELTFSVPPTKKELVQYKKDNTGYKKRWAIHQLDKLKKDGSLLSSYPYPIQIWKLGDQPIIALGGELVVEYAIELKKLFGNGIIVMGYSNDDMAYIPSEKILEEGGYEGERSQIYYGMPSKWDSDIQSKIISEIEKLAKEIGLHKLSYTR